MLESITLEHFKGYEKFHVIFPPGLTLITGANFSGKTRLLHAILFAFWGVSAVPGGSKLVTTRGRKPGETKVTAQFYHHGNTYRVERKVATAQLFRGEDLIASGTSAVNKEMESVLNAPQKFFLRLKYAEQSETQALLTLGAAELHKVIEHVSGANIVNRVIERASKVATAAQAGLDALGPTCDLPTLREDEQRLSANLTTMHKELEAAKAADSTTQARVDLVKKALQEARAHNTKNMKIKQDRHELESRLVESHASHKAALDEIEIYQAEADTCQALTQELADANEYARLWKTLQESLTRLRSDVGSAQAKLKVAEKALVGYQASLKALGTHDNSNALQAKIDAHAKYTAALNKAGELERAAENAVCPTCNRPFEGQDVEAMVKQWHASVGQCEAAGIAYSTACEYAKQEEDKMRLIGHAQGQLDKATADAVRLREEEMRDFKILNASEDQARTMQQPPTEEYFKNLNSQGANAMRAAGAVASGQRSALTASARINAITEKLDEGEQPQPLVDTNPMVAELDQLGQQAKDSSSQVLSLTSAYGVRYSEWAQLSTQVANEEALQDQVKSLQRDKDVAGGLAKYLRSNRDRFLQELWDQVMGYASDFASTCTGGAIERVERTAGGAFQFIEEGEVAMIEGASGAQKAIMSIGVQLALDTLLPDTFGALLMDEPTSQMDVNRSLMLTQTLSQTGRQIIMVSHREMDATVAQSHIHLE
ncbi:MAG: AAA family ATPase [Pseudomonadota bacterium]|nr:AAA family ATPase [Pseudomonadota bacterium]